MQSFWGIFEEIPQPNRGLGGMVGVISQQPFRAPRVDKKGGIPPLEIWVSHGCLGTGTLDPIFFREDPTVCNEKNRKVGPRLYRG